MSFVLSGVVVFTLEVILAELQSTVSHGAAQTKWMIIGPLHTRVGLNESIAHGKQRECFEHMPANRDCTNSP